MGVGHLSGWSRFDFQHGTARRRVKLVEMHHMQHNQYGNGLMEAACCVTEKNIIDFLKSNQHQLGDHMVAQLCYSIVNKRIRLTNIFKENAIPIIINAISQMTKDNSMAFGKILRYLAFAEIDSDELWKEMESIFVKHRMERYVPLENLSLAVLYLSEWNKNENQIVIKSLPVLKQNINKFTIDVQERILRAGSLIPN